MIFNSLRYVIKENSDVDNCDLIIYSPKTLSDIDDIPCFMSADEFNEDFRIVKSIYEPEREEHETDEKTKFFKRVSRSKNMIRDISYNNGFNLFYTQTFNHDKFTVYDENKLYNEFIRGYLKDYIKYRNSKGSDMAYLIIPDMHKDNAFHYHGLVRGDWDLTEYKRDELNGLPHYIRKEVLKGNRVFTQKHY